MVAFGPTPMAFVVIAPVSAVLLHEIVLKRVEVDHLTLQLVATSIAVYWLLVYYSGVLFAYLTAAAFFASLRSYILLYRAFFHPLRSFPGPFGARLSKW